MFFWRKKSLRQEIQDFIKRNLKRTNNFIERNLEEGADEIVNLLEDAKLSDSIKIKENIFGYLIMLLTWYFLISYFGNYSSDTFVGFTLPVILFYSIISVLSYNIWRMVLGWIINRFLSRWNKYRIGFLGMISVVILGVTFLILLAKNSGQASFWCGNDGTGFKEASVISLLIVTYFFVALIIPSRNIFRTLFVGLTSILITASVVLAFWFFPATYFWWLKETSGYLVFKNEASFNEFIKNFLAADNFCETWELRNMSLLRARELFPNAYYDPISKMYSYKATEYFQDDKYRYMSSDWRKKKVSIDYEFWPEVRLSLASKPYYWKYDNKLNDQNANSIVTIPLSSLSKFLSINTSLTQSNSLNYSNVLSGLYTALAYEKQNDCKASVDKNTSEQERIERLRKWLESGELYMLWQNFIDSTGKVCEDLRQFIMEYGENKKMGMYKEENLDNDYKEFLLLVWNIYNAYIKIWTSGTKILHDKWIDTIDDCIQLSDDCFPTLKSPALSKHKYEDNKKNWSLYIRKMIND